MPQNPASNCREVIGQDDAGRAVQCPKAGNRSGYCAKHYKQWANAALRCDYQGCSHILTHPGGSSRTRRIRGRRMLWPDGKTHALCRKHEVLHLRLTPEIHKINLGRLGQGARAGGIDRQCWIWTDGTGRRTDEGYGLMVPEGANDLHWTAHRVSWLLLNSTGWGHSQTQEIAHRCNTRACINPAHLEPATRRANAKDKTRKSRAASRRYWGPVAHNFAVKNELPNPFPLRDWSKANPWNGGLLVEPVTEYGMPALQGTRGGNQYLNP